MAAYTVPFIRAADRAASAGAAIVASLTFVALFAGAALPGPAGAQTIMGYVVEHENDQPLEGVHLRLLNDDEDVVATTFSDEAGAFTFAIPRSGTWRVSAEMIGFATARSSPLTVGREGIIEVEIRMAIDPVELEDAVVVVAERSYSNPNIRAFHERRIRGEKSGFGHFIEREDLAHRSGARATDILRTVPGITLVRLRGTNEQLIRMRGGCVPAIFVDGTQINYFSRTEPLDNYVDITSIEGIEVYRASQQPGTRYFDRNGCGLVLVWTRPGQYDPEGSNSWVKTTIGVLLILGIVLLGR